MSRSLPSAAVVLFFLAGAAVAREAGPPAAPGHVRAVVRLKGAPATDAANTLLQLLGQERKAAPADAARSVVIVPDAVSNSIVLGGPSEAVADVRKLIEELDRPAMMVQIEVVLADVPVDKPGAGPEPAKDEKTKPAAKMVRAGDLPQGAEVLVRAQLTTLENSPARLQMGSREPRITGSTASPRGRVNSLDFENVGTVLALTPRVGPDRSVTLEIEVEDSRLGPREEGAAVAATPEGESVHTPGTDVFSAKATVRIPDGHSALVGGMSRPAKPARGEAKARVILVSPRVLAVGGK